MSAAATRGPTAGQDDPGQAGGSNVDTRSRTRRRHLVDVSALTAIASLVVALIFNGLAVRDSAKQESETRLATQLQLLTQLNGLVAQSESTVQPLDAEFLRAEARDAQLSYQTNSEFSDALKNMDYLAWLFNNGYVGIRSSRELWGQRMECMYVSAVLVYGPTVEQRLQNLARFVDLPRGASFTRLRSVTC